MAKDNTGRWVPRRLDVHIGPLPITDGSVLRESLMLEQIRQEYRLVLNGKVIAKFADGESAHEFYNLLRGRPVDAIVGDDVEYFGLNGQEAGNGR